MFSTFHIVVYMRFGEARLMSGAVDAWLVALVG